MPKIDIPHLKDYSSPSLDGFFQTIQDAFEREQAEAHTPDAMESLRIRWVGRKQGLMNQIGEVLKRAPVEARKDAGTRFNRLKERILKAQIMQHPKQTLDAVEAVPDASPNVPDAIDVTLPGIRPARGAEHPLLRTMQEIVSVSSVWDTRSVSGRRSKPITTILSR